MVATSIGDFKNMLVILPTMDRRRAADVRSLNDSRQRAMSVDNSGPLKDSKLLIANILPTEVRQRAADVKAVNGGDF